MPKVIPEDYHYKGRRADRAVLNLSMDKEGAALLRHYSGGKKVGELVSRLVHRYHGQQVEKQRLREKLALVLNENEE